MIQTGRSRVAGQCVRPSIVAIAIALSAVACDKFMDVHVVAKDASGTPVSAAQMEITIRGGTPLVIHASTSDTGVAQRSHSYGFGSRPRLLVVRKAGYKSYATELVPQPRYSCEVVLRTANEREPSTGTCVAK